MDALNPVSEDGLQLNCGIGEHILRTTQCTHGVVVNVKTKAVEAKEDTYPVEVRNNCIALTQHAIEQVVYILGRIIIANHEDTRVSSSTTDTEAADPHVMCKERNLSSVAGSNVRISRHRVHMLSDDDA